MPISYTIDRQRNLVLTTATGVLTDEELLDHKRELIADPEFEPGMKELSDVRGIERLDVSPAGVRRLVALDQEHVDRLGQDYRLAIVAPADASFGTARMYQMLTEANVENIGVFRDMDEAKDWLGVASGGN